MQAAPLLLLLLGAACGEGAVIAVGADAEPRADDVGASGDADGGSTSASTDARAASEDAASEDARAEDARAEDAAQPPDAGAEPARCPTIGARASAGSVRVRGLRELSGIVPGETSPDVYWAHNDSKVDLYAIDRATLALVAVYHLTDPSGARYGDGDVEDIALRALPGGGAELVIGDIGSGHPDALAMRLYRVTEPSVPRGASIDAELVAEVMDVSPIRVGNAETLLLDPITGELALVRKDGDAFACPIGPFTPGATARPRCDVRVPGLSNPSGGDVSPDGRYVVLRNEDEGFVWLRPPGGGMLDAFAGLRCPFTTIATRADSSECNGEAVAFTRSGDGLVTASEFLDCADAELHTYTFTP